MFFQKSCKLYRFLFAIIIWITLFVVSIWCTPNFSHRVLKSNQLYELTLYSGSKNSRRSVSHVTDGFDNLFQAHHVFSEIRPFISSNINTVVSISSNNTEPGICLLRPQSNAIYFIKAVRTTMNFLRRFICSLLDYLIILTKKIDNCKSNGPDKSFIVISKKNTTDYVTISTPLPTVTRTVTRLVKPITKVVTSTSIKKIRAPRLKLGKKALPNVSTVDKSTADHVVKIQFKLPN